MGWDGTGQGPLTILVVKEIFVRSGEIWRVGGRKL
jgi:hypothetical protein